MTDQSTRWIVQVKGEGGSLEKASHWLKDPELSVDRSGDVYYLTSTDFDSLTEHGQVDQHAALILEAANGAIRIKDPTYQPIEITGAKFREDPATGKRDVFISPDPVHLKIRANLVTVTVGGKEVTPPSVLNRVRAAQQNPVVERVLRLMESPNFDFIDMYKVYEEVRDDAGNERELVARGWTTAAERERFTRTVNTSTDGRHRLTKFDPPKKPMKRKEAREYVAKLVDQWLNQKHGV